MAILDGRRHACQPGPLLEQARAGSYGSEGWGSSPSERAQVRASFRVRKGSFANALANSGTLDGGRDSAGEDVGGLGELIADDVHVHPQRDRGIGMTEPDGDHMH
jgi:hypothetical protein